MGATKRTIDFTNVKEGGNFSKKHMPAGDYLAKVIKVEDAMPKDKDDKTPMWLFTIQLKETPSATYPYYCKLQENQLWKVRNLLVAAGITVPKKSVGVDPEKLVGKTIAVSLDDTEYNGKDQSEIGSVFSPADLSDAVDVDEPDDEDEDDEDEPPAPKKKAKVEEVEEDDEDEDEEPEPPKKKTKKERRLEREAKAKAAAAAEEDDDEDEDEEPAPKKKAKPAEDDDDDEIDIEDLD